MEYGEIMNRKVWSPVCSEKGYGSGLEGVLVKADYRPGAGLYTLILHSDNEGLVFLEMDGREFASFRRQGFGICHDTRFRGAKGRSLFLSPAWKKCRNATARVARDETDNWHYVSIDVWPQTCGYYQMSLKGYRFNCTLTISPRAAYDLAEGLKAEFYDLGNCYKIQIQSLKNSDYGKI